MKVSAKIEYACIAALELAASYGSNEPVRIGTIAGRHGVPSRFLVQILLQLKSAGLVTSTRGASGGYRLLKSPTDITLGEVMAVIGGHEEQLSSAAAADSPFAGALRMCWQEIADQQRAMLESVTLADLLQRAARNTGTGMYHI